MSRASALIWVVICTVLGALVWWTTPRPTIETQGPPLVSVSASEIRSIRITDPAGATGTLERGPFDGVWLLQLGSGPRNVADSGRVQGFLRLLSELRTTTAADTRPMPRAAMVRLVGPAGVLASVALDPDFLAGRGRAALVDDSGVVLRVASTSEDLAALVKPEALAEWRSKSLLPWAPDRSHALTLGRRDIEPSRWLSAERSGSGWLLTAPLKLRAETAAAQGVSLWLANASIDRFLDQAPSEGFQPVRTLVVATDSLERRRIEQRIELGPELDPRSSLVRVHGVNADSGATLWGPSYAVLQTSLLAGITDNPAGFLTKVSFPFAAADVTAIAIDASERPISRGPDGGFGSADANARALLRLLTEIPATQISILPSESTNQVEPSSDAVTVRLLGVNNAELGRATLEADTIPSRTEGAPSVPAIRVTVDRVRRVIATERPREFLASVKALAANR